MNTPTTETRQKTTPEERRIAKQARKAHNAHVHLVIGTYERMINVYARSGRREECQELADEMMARAVENPEDFGRWKSVVVQVSSPAEPEETPEP